MSPVLIADSFTSRNLLTEVLERNATTNRVKASYQRDKIISNNVLFQFRKKRLFKKSVVFYGNDYS